MKTEINVTFKTITPLWTGDAWGECNELKPSAIIGGLRFWFEVYCHFAGIKVREKEELNYKKFIEKRRKNLEKNEFEILKELEITCSSRVFGCTGWKSKIEISKINLVDDYCFGNHLNFLSKVCIKKRSDAQGNCPNRSNDFWSVWHLPNPYFYGNFKIIFKTTEEIKNNILLPLLRFIEQYGFIGGKNNLGYGRVKIKSVDNEDIDLSEYGFNLNVISCDKNIEDSIFEDFDENNISNLNKEKIEIIKVNFEKESLSALIKGLLKKKADFRRAISDKYERHYKFGSTARDTYKGIQGPNATKIIPLISKDENGHYVGNFLSIWGIQNFGDEQ